MGCCSSSKTVPHSTSPTNAPISNVVKSENNTNSNPHQLQQHHDINQGQSDANDDDNDEIPISKSFANNQSIVKEVMRLKESEVDNYKNYTNTNIEIKSNENSEDIQIISNDENRSFAEFTTETINIENNKSPSYHKHQQEIIKENVNISDSYHPFSMIQTDESQNEIIEQHKKKEDNAEQEIVEDLEALYAENLKQHGFDADKFRTANLSVPKLSENLRHDTTQRSLSADLSSFASSQLSSQFTSKSETVDKDNNNKIDIMNNNIDDIIVEEDDDEEFMLQELSRPNSMYQDEINENDNQQTGYIESIKESVKDSNQINDIMDDEDEELMDAILSLDLED